MARVHLLLDEAATLGPMDCLSDLINLGRAYGLSGIFIYQSPAQLKEVWPEKEHNFLANVTQIHFGVNDYEWAEQVSLRLGEFTAVAENGSEGGSTSTSEPTPQRNHSHSWQRGWSQVARRLMRAEEILTLDPSIAIVLTQSMPPLWVRMVPYFDKGFAAAKLSAWRVALGVLVCLFVAGVSAALAVGVATGRPVFHGVR